MLKTIVIDSESNSINILTDCLKTNFPKVEVCGSFTSTEAANASIEKINPNLVFVDATLPDNNKKALYFYSKNAGFEIIITAKDSSSAIEAINYELCGYVLKPIDANRLSKAIGNVKNRLKKKEENNEKDRMLRELMFSDKKDKIIGIPTIEGFEFINVRDIIRCEGLQKCTRIITCDRSDIISSYNVGEFKKLLLKYRFFAPHKSHLINLRKIVRYNREGTIIMCDKSAVPVARRRKCAFLSQLEHL